jgi:hypothetical protein
MGLVDLEYGYPLFQLRILPEITRRDFPAGKDGQALIERLGTAATMARTLFDPSYVTERGHIIREEYPSYPRLETILSIDERAEEVIGLYEAYNDPKKRSELPLVLGGQPYTIVAEAERLYVRELAEAYLSTAFSVRKGRIVASERTTVISLEEFNERAKMRRDAEIIKLILERGKSF